MSHERCALLFDLDGTLIDSAPSILASMAQALAAHGLAPAVPLDKTLIGPPLRSALQTLSGSSDQDTLDRLAEAFRSNYDSTGYCATAPFPGVTSALRKLHRAGHPMYVVTNKRATPTRRILEHLEWHHFFAAVRTLDTCEPAASGKPEVVRRLIADTGIDTRRALLVGDTAEDANSALGNGLAFAHATWGYGVLGSLPSEPIFQLRHPNEIFPTLTALCGSSSAMPSPNA